MNRPIAPSLAPSPPPHDSTGAERPKACIACGFVHGGIGEGRICLENEVRRLRAQLRALSGGPR